MSTPGSNEHSFDPNSFPGNANQSGNQSFGWEGYPAGTPADQEFQYAAATPQSSPLMNREVKNTGKGFFGALFDANFDHFISVKFAKIIYILALIVTGIFVFCAWILPALFAFVDDSIGLFVTIFLFGWIPVGAIALVQLVTTRLFLEFVVALIKTSQNTSEIAENTRA